MVDLPVREDLLGVLIERCQWVCWLTEDLDGTSTKDPLDLSTLRLESTTALSTWRSFNWARECTWDTEEVARLGFVFAECDPYLGINLDDYRDPDTENSTERAKDILDRLDSYTEASLSAGGSHVIV